MKEVLVGLVAQAPTEAYAVLLVREYLQARVLEALQRAGAFRQWAFLGGTALRFLYRLPRFSEDLDFSTTTSRRNTPADATQKEFRQYMERVRKAFEAETYAVEIRDRPEPVVQSAFIAFPGLLYELGLSPHREQKISIKIEVDTNPPPHAGTETSLTRRHVLLNILHYDKPSLLAGKLHALLQRPYEKGRDVYDLVWYLSDSSWPAPNLKLLQSSMAQTGVPLSEDEVVHWRRLLAARVEQMNWDRVLADVQPFLEQSREIEMLTRENVLKLIGG